MDHKEIVVIKFISLPRSCQGCIYNHDNKCENKYVSEPVEDCEMKEVD